MPTITREEVAKEFYSAHCEIPLPWMSGNVQNNVKDIISAMIDFADAEIEKFSRIPFGIDVVMTATGGSKDKAFIAVRAVGDEFIGSGKPADEAWAASEISGGPAWLLMFDSSDSARHIAKLCTEIAETLAE